MKTLKIALCLAVLSLVMVGQAHAGNNPHALRAQQKMKH